MPATFQTAWVAAFLVVPGYVYLFFLEAARVRKRRDPLLIVLESLAMSLVMWVLAWFFIGVGVLGDATALAQGSVEMRHLLGPVAVLLLAPALLGVVVGAVFRRWPVTAQLLGLRPTLPRAWDHTFRGREVAFVRITLCNGGYVAGIWGAGSLASPYPEPEDLFLEVQWTVDERGVIGLPIPGSAGVWIPGREVRVLELLTPQLEEPDEDQRSS
ncbi:MAG: hypothetical protein JWN48_1740 [Myxococcaceae bacterium]|nr:hypothetical protein [Myxococcaceae bacterium]